MGSMELFSCMDRQVLERPILWLGMPWINPVWISFLKPRKPHDRQVKRIERIWTLQLLKPQNQERRLLFFLCLLRGKSHKLLMKSIDRYLKEMSMEYCYLGSKICLSRFKTRNQVTFPLNVAILKSIMNKFLIFLMMKDLKINSKYMKRLLRISLK